MAACTFHQNQNALLTSRVNDCINMTRNRLMIRNFSTTKTSTSCPIPVISRRPLASYNDFSHSRKMYIRHPFCCGQLSLLPYSHFRSSTNRKHFLAFVFRLKRRVCNFKRRVCRWKRECYRSANAAAIQLGVTAMFFHGKLYTSSILYVPVHVKVCKNKTNNVVL